MTETLTDAGLKLMAHRLVENYETYNIPSSAPVGYVRLYHTAAQYIELPVCRNLADATNMVFDDTGGSESDPEYASVTQYYKDLNLITFIPKFNVRIDDSVWSNGYCGVSWAISTFELYNLGGVLVADGTFSETISRGTRYRLTWKFRVLNDMVSQMPERKSRSVVTTSGLRVVMRRLLQNNTTQDIGSIPSFIGVGSKNSYYIANGSDAQGYYDATGPSYTATTAHYFPLAPAVGDAWWYARQGSAPDTINGWYFDVGTAGVQADDTAIKVQYYEGAAWHDMKSYDDQTNGFAIDGYVIFEAPVDIEVVAANTFYGGSPQGHYYRIVIVGANFSTKPVPNAATQPMVLKTLQDETDLIMPVNRRPAEMMVSPFSGSVAKFSTEISVGHVPEIYDKDTGVLLRKAYMPVSEIGLFTADGLVEDEEVELTTVTATANADGEISFATATHAEPLKVLVIRRTSNGRIYQAGGFCYWYVSGANYVMQIGGPASVEYEITYLPKEISPSKTFDNILAVYGDNQRLDGPFEVYSGSVKENPIDTEKNDLYKRLNPSHIKSKGRKHYDSDVAAVDPNFTNPGTISPHAKVSLVTDSIRKEKYAMSDFFHDVQKFKRHQNFSFRFGYPYIMLTFNTADYERVNDVTLYLSVIGGFKGKMGYAIAVWGKGRPGEENEAARYDSWRFIHDTGDHPISVGSDGLNPAVGSVKISPEYYTDHEGNSFSPIINEQGDVHVLIVGKTFGKGNSNRIKFGSTTGHRSRMDQYGWPISAGKIMRERAKIKATKYSSALTVNYAGLSINPVQDAGDRGYAFRRGVDWTHVFGEDHADWHKESESDVDWAVTTADGITYEPLLPSSRLGIKKEKFIFGTNPGTGAAEYRLYLEKRPYHNITGAYVEKEGQEDMETSNNGEVDVKYVGWDDSIAWNATDPSYSHNHNGGAAGDGAGFVAVDFNNEDWTATKIRHVLVEYMYMDDPRLSMDYLIQDGLLFARAHFSELSFSPPLQPHHGDRMRLYYEVEFKRRRT